MEVGTLKVALVHDWLVSMRGAERCLESMCEIFPNAEIFTLFHDKGSVSDTIESRMIHTSFLQGLPGRRRWYRSLLPLMPLAIEQFDFHGFDLVVSSSWCCAKGIVVPHGVPHVSYIYTPMRFGWDLHAEYFGTNARGNRISKSLANMGLHGVRMWDVASSGREDQKRAISKFVARRIQKSYGMESEVIYPPVDIGRFSTHKPERREDYYLMVTSFEPNKHVDVAIDVFNELELPLKIVGNAGRYRKQLRSRAGRTIEFLGRVSDEVLPTLYANARAFVHPAVEDFGIAIVEAMAAGTPVVAYGRGGAAETVVDGVTGVLFDKMDPSALAASVKKCGSMVWDRNILIEHVQKFDKKRFQIEFKEYVKEAYNRELP